MSAIDRAASRRSASLARLALVARRRYEDTAASARAWLPVASVCYLAWRATV